MGNCFDAPKGGNQIKSTTSQPTTQTGGSTGGRVWDGTEVGNEVKIILLGAGESGKSTFFRQISHLLSQINQHEFKGFIPSIYENIWRMTQQCCLSCHKRNPNEPFENDKTREANNVIAGFEKDFGEFKEDYGYTTKVFEAIQACWADKKFVDTFNKYKGLDFHVNDGWEYLFQSDNLSRFKPQPNFVPTFEDIIQTRKKTVGINKIKYSLDNKDYILIDVGGQRNERKKWANALENVASLVFVASLGDFDQVCYEDDVTNRMKEAIELFEKTVNNVIFLDKKVVLMLNKKDVMRVKIQKRELSDTFEDYKGGHDYDAALAFITEKFREVIKGEKDRIVVKYCQATDASNIKEVFEEVKQILKK
jgi:guanine nucleotide-binding protein G(i) subunit alpha